MATNLFYRIVVPTDFSDCSEEAWGLAKRVAGTLGSEVVLAHVFVEPIVYGDPASGRGHELAALRAGAEVGGGGA